MKYIIGLFLLLIASNLYAQDSDNGTIIGLTQGERAPFDGVLLDKKAASTVLAQDNFDKEKCELDCAKDAEIAKVQSDSVIAQLQLSLDFERKEHEKTIEYYDAKLQYIQDYKVEPPPDDDDLMWSLIGASIGVITTSITYGIIVSL